AVFADPAVDPGLQGGDALRQWRYMNDYQKIPDHLCGSTGCADDGTRMNVIKNRQWVTFDPQNPPPNEVPSELSSHEYNHLTPFCSTFDYGSNLRQIFANYYTNWSQYFFFNNSLRDRLTPLSWDPNRAIVPAENAMVYVDTVGQYLYYMNALDPTFRTT